MAIHNEEPHPNKRRLRTGTFPIHVNGFWSSQNRSRVYPQAQVNRYPRSSNLWVLASILIHKHHKHQQCCISNWNAINSWYTPHQELLRASSKHNSHPAPASPTSVNGFAIRTPTHQIPSCNHCLHSSDLSNRNHHTYGIQTHTTPENWTESAAPTSSSSPPHTTSRLCSDRGLNDEQPNVTQHSHIYSQSLFFIIFFAGKPPEMTNQYFVNNTAATNVSTFILLVSVAHGREYVQTFTLLAYTFTYVCTYVCMKFKTTAVLILGLVSTYLHTYVHISTHLAATILIAAVLSTMHKYY